MKIDWGKAFKATADAAVGAGVVTYFAGPCWMVFVALGIALAFNAARQGVGFDVWGFVFRLLPEPVRAFLDFGEVQK